MTFRGVLIGKTIEVEGDHLRGKVIDETRQTLTLKTQKGEKKIVKKQHMFIINNSMIKGAELLGRPEERIKST
jgi:RNase P/RNase MRP subunit p29